MCVKRVAGIRDVMYEFKYPSSNIKFITAEGHEFSTDNFVGELQSILSLCFGFKLKGSPKLYTIAWDLLQVKNEEYQLYVIGVLQKSFKDLMIINKERCVRGVDCVECV